jgi:hypothetical protein
MKSSVFTTLVVIGLWLFANVTPTAGFTNKCRKTFLQPNPELDASQALRQDLTSGVWTFVDKNGLFNSVTFTEYGLAETLNVEEEGNIRYSDMLWRLEEKEGSHYVMLMGHDMKHEHKLAITQNCEGVVLQDAYSYEITKVNYLQKASPQVIEALEVNLLGDWTNITTPFDESKSRSSGIPSDFENSFLSYSFEADHSFTCTYGNESSFVEEKGYWRIWEDGKYLIFFVKESPDSDCFCDIRVAKLNYLDSHSLFIEHEMLARDLMGFKNMPNKGMGFIK